MIFHGDEPGILRHTVPHPDTWVANTGDLSPSFCGGSSQDAMASMLQHAREGCSACRLTVCSHRCSRRSVSECCIVYSHFANVRDTMK
jgi:hypothetical protein